MLLSAEAPPLRLVQELMTLAGLAYGDQPNIAGYLATGPLTRGIWDLYWIADDTPTPDTFAFIAHDKARGAYAIAIRGTYPNPLSQAYWDDANLDTPYGPMAPWPGDPSGSAKIAKGTWTAFSDLIALSGSGRSFADAVGALPRGAPLYVTGHSLGGTLSPVVGLWVHEQFGLVPSVICPFAGMTPGNGAFARLLDGNSSLAGRTWRYNNTLDTVPYGWNRVWATRGFYRPAPTDGLLVYLALTIAGIILWFYRFEAIGSEIKLPGAVQPPELKFTLLAYVAENLRQHLPETYLALLNAPPLPFVIGFGSIVAPANSHPNSRIWLAKRRPYYLS